MRWTLLVMLPLGELVHGGLGLPIGTNPQTSPHIIRNLKWTIQNVETGKIAVLAQGTGHYPSPGWWWNITFDLCHLAQDSWPDTAKTKEDSYPPCRFRSWYICPGRQRTWKCGGPEAYYCASWGCETSSNGYWLKSSPRNDYAHFWQTIQGESNITVQFTSSGKQQPDWTQGYLWGLRIYTPGQYNPGLLFRLKLTTEQPTGSLIGPNQVLGDQKAPSEPKQPIAPTIKPSPSSQTITMGYQTFNHTPEPTYPGTGDRLFNLVRGAFFALNATSPNRTQDCWLCLTSRPPYYEGVAMLSNLTSDTITDPKCYSLRSYKLTITEVMGQGVCLGKVPLSRQHLCNINRPINQSQSDYLWGPKGSYFACNTGLTPCVSMAVLNATTDFCVLIQLWPRISYHGSDYVLGHLEGHVRLPREPITMTIAVLLGIGGIATGIGTGTAAYVQGGQLLNLQMAMNEDLIAMAKSITALEKSLTSLSEVVLQNRRGLDLLFLREGGLCVALKEQCCFYADHTGVVRETMEKVTERLAKRQKEFEAQQGWFEQWFKNTPWLTPLISTVMGPLFGLLLIAAIGPCLVKRVTQFIKDQINILTSKPIQTGNILACTATKDRGMGPPQRWVSTVRAVNDLRQGLLDSL
uniref:Envelope glycoprotein n=1 Tax=Spermophilus dauricus TaxID=99837 RepID=A0A8C9P565_SPEDA